ncbi:MAG: response regulator [Acidimicrobiia bacterium]|nr:response regulator [Acidimicrobiia bacterium]
MTGPPANPLSGATPSPGRTRVLIVDDEPPSRALLERLLREDGYQTSTAPDGETALEMIAANPPDLVLLDVQMTGMDGFEVCRRLKAPESPVRLMPVILVAGIGEDHKVVGIEAGADDFINKPFKPAEIRARVRSLVRLKHYIDELDSAEAIIRSLAMTIEARDAYTEGHCDRLARYAAALGREIGLGQEEIAALERGGYMHDIGKVGIPDAILHKDGRLTAAERKTMQQHTVIGDHLCHELRSLRLVRGIIRHHHERWDGSGYPDGLTGDRIPVLAQIVGIVDVFDAMTTDRSYQAARPAAEAVAELERGAREGRFHADLVRPFVDLVARGVIVPPPRG